MSVNSVTLEKPYTFTKTGEIHHYSISLSNYIFNTSADIFITFTDKDRRIVTTDSIRISGDLFKNWGSDDRYIYDLIESNMDHFILGKDLIIQNMDISTNIPVMSSYNQYLSSNLPDLSGNLFDLSGNIVDISGNLTDISGNI